jgi:hypothetical protein
VPTAFANLEIRVGPAQPTGTAEGKTPLGPSHRVTTFGILGSVIAGIVGAVLTLRIASGLIVPAFAELALAFTSVVLIAMGRTTVGQESMRQEISENPGIPRRPAVLRLGELRLNRLPSGANISPGPDGSWAQTPRISAAWTDASCARTEIQAPSVYHLSLSVRTTILEWSWPRHPRPSM